MYFGIDGNTGKIVDIRNQNIWDPYLVKEQCIKTAIETSSMFLRIDDIISGLKGKKE